MQRSEKRHLNKAGFDVLSMDGDVIQKSFLWSQTWTIYATVHEPYSTFWTSGKNDKHTNLSFIQCGMRKVQCNTTNRFERPFAHCDKTRKKWDREFMETLIERRRCARTTASAMTSKRRSRHANDCRTGVQQSLEVERNLSLQSNMSKAQSTIVADE